MSNRLDRQTIRYDKDIQCSDIGFVSVILSIWKTNNNREEDDLKSGTITVTNFSEGTSAIIAPCHIRQSEVVKITVPNCNQYIAFPNFLSKQVKNSILKNDHQKPLPSSQNDIRIGRNGLHKNDGMLERRKLSDK